MNEVNYRYRDDVVEQRCTKCGTEFLRHRESEVYLCLACYEDNVVTTRRRKDTVFFILKMGLAALLMIWSFFAYTTSKAGNKDAKIAGMLEAVATAGASVWVGKSAWKTWKKTRK